MPNTLIRQAYKLTLFFAYSSSLHASNIEDSHMNDFSNVNTTNENSRVKRSAPTYEEFFWENGIVKYTFSENKFSENEKSNVRKAMQTLESIANVSFLELTNIVHFDDLVTIKKGSRCKSSVGRNPYLPDGLKRTVTLSSDRFCFSQEILLHEFMHTLGFHHEHSRFDRDKYVEIITKNIDPNGIQNFKKHGEMTVRFGEYDYDSIMHYAHNTYGKDEYTIRRAYTIKPLKENVAIGNKMKLSKGDKEALIKAYGLPINKNKKYIEFKNKAGFNAQIKLKYFYDQTNSNQWDYYSWWGMLGEQKTYTLPSNVDYLEVNISFRSIFKWYDLEYITYIKDDLPICLETWGTLFSPQLSRC